MAVPDGKPATSFNAMDREWVRAVAKEEGGGGIPAPENPSNGDVLTYNSTSGEWEADAPSESVFPVVISYEEVGSTDVYTFSPSIEDIIAATEAGKILLGVWDGQTATEVTALYNSENDWRITITFITYSIDAEEGNIVLYVDAFNQTNSDESMTYSSAEAIIPIAT